MICTETATDLTLTLFRSAMSFINLQIVQIKFSMLRPLVRLIIRMVGNAFATLEKNVDCCLITAVSLLWMLDNVSCN